MYFLSSQTELLDPSCTVFGHQVYECGIHRHRAHECLWVLKGLVRVQVDDRVYSLSAGDLMVINSDEPHATQAASEDNLIVCVQRRFESVLSVNCGPWLTNSMQRTKMDRMRTCLAHIWWEHEYRRPYWELAVEGYLQELQLLLLRYFAGEESLQQIVKTDQHERMDALIRYLEQHYDEHISLGQLADREGLSEAYLSRYFKEHTGYTFHRYLTLLRLEQSIMDLAGKDTSIADIALNNGFPSIKAYNTAFKREYQCTPGEFRQREQQSLPIAHGRIYGEYDPGNLLRLVTPWLDQEALYL